MWRSLGKTNNRRKEKNLKVDKLSSMKFFAVEKSIASKLKSQQID